MQPSLPGGVRLETALALTFWRWRCRCWLRAFLARTAASRCSFALGSAALMLRRGAEGCDLVLASEPPLCAGGRKPCKTFIPHSACTPKEASAASMSSRHSLLEGHLL